MARREGVSPVLRCRAALLRLLATTPCSVFSFDFTLGAASALVRGSKARGLAPHLYNDSIKLVGEEELLLNLAHALQRAAEYARRGVDRGPVRVEWPRSAAILGGGRVEREQPGPVVCPGPAGASPSAEPTVRPSR